MDIETVRSAYRKLKSFIYFDNSNLLLRMKLADFECDGEVDNKLNELALKITEYSSDDSYWDDLLKYIARWKVVKQYENTPNNRLIITNLRNEDSYKVDRVNNFINAPIELHICAAIWLCEVGFQLEPNMAVEPYGNKLELIKERDRYTFATGLKSYKPYFGQYQRWRDEAVEAAKAIVDKDKNALILGLDIKNFYHSVRIDIDKVHDEIFPKGITSELLSICAIFSRVIKQYTEHMKVQDEQGRCILPIGLISSGVLANYYLDPLDKQLNSKLRPDFYGRYVDDILLVTSCPDEEGLLDLQQVVDQYLVDPNIFKQVEGDPDSYCMTESGYENTMIQTEKLAVFHFSSSEPTALLDKFSAELKRNSSEYRLLPEDEVVDYDFDMAAYNLSYTGTGNKLSDIKGFGEDKFGVSKYLAKKIFLALQSGHESDDEAVRKVVRFFRGKRSVELYALWEKVFTFLLLNKDHASIFKVVREILASIDRIKQGKAEEWGLGSTQFYTKHLYASLSMAFALKPSVLDSTRFIMKLEAAIEGSSFSEVYDFSASIKALRLSNLIRHGYVVHPLLNYVAGPKTNEFYDLIDYKEYFKLATNKLMIDRKMYRYSPRFVHFHEVSMLHIINRVSNTTTKFYESGLSFTSTVSKNQPDYLDEAAKDYYKLNYTRRHVNVENFDKDYLDIKNKLFKLEDAKKANSWVREVKVEGGVKKSNLKVAVANIAINNQVLSHEYLRKPIIDPVRRKDFNAILNQAEEQKADLLVMPEISVPIAWLKWISDYALRQQRALVFGLEHWIVGRKAFNFLVTMMPVVVDGFKSLIINIRLKNHYSPAEIHMLEGYGYIVPEVKNPSYDLFKWKGCHFTTFNCYELSNIEHRSRFKSKVDLLVASEFNKDIKYFSNLVESTARDIHCYVVQVNDSKYGDSRVTQPARSYEKDLINVKGGINPTILVDKLDIMILREFQLKEYSGQKDMGIFKATPPDFNKKNVLHRMDD